MATYAHIYDLHVADTALMNRTEVAIVKHAQYLLALPGTADQLTWARAALANPRGKVDGCFWEVVVQPSIADAPDTAAVTDAALATIVDSICEKY